MGLLIAIAFAVFAVAEARHIPSVELYEIRDLSETRNKNHGPVLQRIHKLDSKTNAAALAKYISNLALLDHGHGKDSSEDEEGFIDETRSSIVVVPADKNILNKIFKSANKARGSGRVYRLQRGQSNDDYCYGKRTKRDLEPQWEIPVKYFSRKS